MVQGTNIDIHPQNAKHNEKTKDSTVVVESQSKHMSLGYEDLKSTLNVLAEEIKEAQASKIKEMRNSTNSKNSFSRRKNP